MIADFRLRIAECGGQMKKREPQNTEQGIMNVEGEKTSSFEIPCSIFKLGVSGYQSAGLKVQGSMTC